jgi:hypothetical protein
MQCDPLCCLFNEHEDDENQRALVMLQSLVEEEVVEGSCGRSDEEVVKIKTVWQKKMG